MLITPSFKKSLIVEQFQGNYLKLAEENARASLLKKLLNLSALNCCKWSVGLVKIISIIA